MPRTGAISNPKNVGVKVHVIGEPGVTTGNIINRLELSETVMAVLKRNLLRLARHLKVPTGKRQELEADLFNNRKDVTDALECILLDWKMRNAEKATIENLIQTLKDIEMTEAAELLQNTFWGKNETPPASPSRNRSTQRRLFSISDADGSGDLLVKSGSPSKTSKASGENHNYNPLFHKTIKVLSFASIVLVLTIISVAYTHIHSRVTQLASNNVDIDDTKGSSGFDSHERYPGSQEYSDKAEVPVEETYAVHNIAVASYNDYETKIRFIQTCCLHLNISIDQLSVWSSNSSMSKAHHIRRLHLKGLVTQTVFASILKQTFSITFLRISNQDNLFCKTFQKFRNTSDSLKNSLELKQLETLVLSKFSTCTEFYHYGSSYFKFDKLEYLEIVGSNLTPENVLSMQNFLSTVGKKLQSIKISGTALTTKKFYNSESYLPHIKFLDLTIKNSELLTTSLLDRSFCIVMPNIENFKADIGMSYSDTLTVLKCKKLRLINATVLFGEKDDFWNINASIKSENIESIQLYFHFPGQCPSTNQVKQLGLDDIDKRTKYLSFSSNCFVASETSDSHEISFVETGAKHGK